MENEIDFGKSLKKTRKRLGVTQAQLAETMGISVQAVSNFEKGKGSPSIKTVCRFSSALGVPALDLLSETSKDKTKYSRANILLKACLEFLEKPRSPSTIYEFMKETVHYDEADRDGRCLMDDIKSYLEFGE